MESTCPNCGKRVNKGQGFCSEKCRRQWYDIDDFEMGEQDDD